MSTRLYLPSSSAAPPISPAVDSAFDVTTGLDRIMATTTKTGTALTSKAAGAVTSQKAVSRQYIYGPLNAVTISGTAKGVIRASGSGGGGVLGWMVIRVLAPNGTTVRGTLLSPSGSYGIAQATLTNMRPEKYGVGNTDPNFALSSVAAQAGDYLVIEPGFSEIFGVSTAGTYNFGDAPGSDLADDDTSTTANAPWIEFSTTMTVLAVRSRSYIVW